MKNITFRKFMLILIFFSGISSINAQVTTDFNPGTGTFNITTAGGYDVFISKLDASGNFVWATGMGGTLIDFANAITVDVSGNVYTTGTFQGTADFDPGSGVFNLTSVANGYDIFVHKTGQAGSGIRSDIENNISNISIYPNPGNGEFVIKTKCAEVLTLLNDLGESIQTFTTNAEENYTVRISDLPAGIYFIAGFNNGVVSGEKIIVKK